MKLIKNLEIGKKLIRIKNQELELGNYQELKIIFKNNQNWELNFNQEIIKIRKKIGIRNIRKLKLIRLRKINFFFLKINIYSNKKERL